MSEYYTETVMCPFCGDIYTARFRRELWKMFPKNTNGQYQYPCPTKPGCQEAKNNSKVIVICPKIKCLWHSAQWDKVKSANKDALIKILKIPYCSWPVITLDDNLRCTNYKKER